MIPEPVDYFKIAMPGPMRSIVGLTFILPYKLKCFNMWHGMAEWSSALDSSFDVSDQQSVGLSSGFDTCVLISKTLYPLLLRPLDGA